MSIEVTMPRLSDTMESGTIVEWKVAVGDKVSSGDVVADVETDKATMELAVYDDGTIASIDVEPGHQVDVGTVIALLAEKGEDPANLKPAASAPAPTPAPTPAPAAAPESAPEPVSSPSPAPAASPAVSAAPAASSSGGGMRISPVARRMAEAAGIPLATIVGTGPSGRIIKRDVEAAMAAGAETVASVPPAANVPAVAAAPIAQPVAQASSSAITPIESMAGYGSPMASRRVPLSNMRQVIARRLVESKTTIPHYQVSMSFDMDPLMTMRKDLNEKLAGGDVKLSVNDFLVRAAALAMHQHPDFNASFDGDAIVQHGAVNVGIAISLPEDKGGGLVVGVIRDADRKSLRMISAESKALAEKARTRGLAPEDMEGATFTISNLGMYGVDHFTAIINPPNSAILAVGGAMKQPVVRGDPIEVGHRMTATLSNDHRVIDGAMAARWLQTVRESVEHPTLLLV
ncbi:MAG: dihydrolipoamide acetyltransferase family protein [Planctomycetota bacterium]|nr:dihydrolipoamide acetyltransferase family protein [Planctomycetota bacterium]